MLEKLPKDKTVYLSDQGLSMSEANHIANMIKERVLVIDSPIIATNSYKKTMLHAGTDILIDNPIPVLDFYKVTLEKGQLFSFSAWLREAIKAKDELLDITIPRMSSDDFLVANEAFILDSPTLPVLPGHGIVKKTVSESDIIGKFTIAEKSEYLTAESMAAHIGNLIHDKGKLAELRRESKNPKVIEYKILRDGGGSKEYPVTLETIYLTGYLDEEFFKLQKEHRVWEQKLNALKSKIKTDISMTQLDEDSKYLGNMRASQNRYATEKSEFDKIMFDRKSHNDNLIELVGIRRKTLTQQVSGLKIIVPKCFQQTLEDIRVL